MIDVFSKSKSIKHAYPFLSPTSIGRESLDKYLPFEPIEFAISKDGKEWTSCFDIPDLDIVYCYRAPDVQPATYTDNLKKVGLQDGSRLLSTSYTTREMKMNIRIEGINESDAMLAYDALQRFLVSRNAYWICFSNWAQRMYYVRSKIAAPNFLSEKVIICEVTFTDLIGLSRSIGTSLDYEDTNGFGNKTTVDPLQYTFTENSFKVSNLSDTIIDPERRGHPFKVTLEGKSSGNMKITNKTTGDSVTRTGMLQTNKDGTKLAGNSSFNGKFVIDGVRATLNGKSDQMQCDDGVLTLQPGINDFQVDNFSGKITFDFPFWWLS
ncbi:hypothetical protein FD27_GL001071 [Limosilactobacillus frumenti DSM 13145]|uniref:Siphovirus-type tail component RIFT-related domain-containing protein n=1 Tax=Limosilactobacillus frumenti DSM 13145 TaxID=1423746 RepID=A0A0R1PBJ6_9LACO|nr:phage tail domain-containing protein [Limosilactobacillus frumenti]KRL27317.1 hypothetical protein FD27_GL001071 [Limosilactobacillus frumenti DSM 13145]QFG72763.1 phage tail family protein [Limosilactobacillus frumenti]